MSKSVVIEFNLDTGEVKAEATGYNGTACSLDMDAVLKEGGVAIKKRQPKTPTQLNQQHLKAGK